MQSRNEGRRKKPLYRIIYEQQRAKIDDGTYREGDLLPYERELCQQYGVDRVTVRQAMRLLVEDGLIEKRTGVGSFVRHAPQPVPAEPEPQSAPQVRKLLYVLPTHVINLEDQPERYNAELFQFLQQTCSRQGIMLVYMLENDPHLDLLEPGEYAGCFVVSRVRPQVLEKLAARMPTMCINNVNPKVSSTLVDDEGGGYLAAEQLIGLGHRKIAMVGGDQRLYTTGMRTRGFLRAMADHALPVDEGSIAYVDETDPTSTCRCVEAILERLAPQRPTAFFFHSDLLAITGMSVMMSRGLRVPEDVSVVGFNNTSISERVYPPLSTVDTQRDLLAEESLALMLRLIDKPQMRRIFISIPALFVARASIGPAPKEPPET